MRCSSVEWRAVRLLAKVAAAAVAGWLRFLSQHSSSISMVQEEEERYKPDAAAAGDHHQHQRSDSSATRRKVKRLEYFL